MRSALLVLLLLAMLGGEAIADDERPAQLTGRLTDSLTGTPVESARVYVTDSAGHQRSTTTGRDGRYAIELEPGLYYVTFAFGANRAVGRVEVERGSAAVFNGRLYSMSQEVIVIRDMVPPKVPPKPVNFSERKAPPYSDAAILRDAWTRAWMVIDISSTGEVLRFKFLKRPGYDLDEIAASEVFKLRFRPARDDNGTPVETWLIWGIEWPANGYLMASGLPRTAMPPMVGLPPRPASDTVPCRGSGPLDLSSIYPTYRDCSTPDLSRMASERWITRP